MFHRARLSLSVAFVLAVMFAFNVTAQEAQVDDEGFIRNWLILAPLPMEGSGAEDIDKEQIKDEAKLQPKEGDKPKAGDKELTWKAVKATDYFFDVCEIIGAPGETGVAYAVAYIVSPEEMKDIDVAMGSNDQGRLYVNGKEAVKVQRRPHPRQGPGHRQGHHAQEGRQRRSLQGHQRDQQLAGRRAVQERRQPIKNLKVKTKP